VRIDHVGIAVRDLEEGIRLYTEALGLVVTHREEVASQKVRVAFLGDPGDPLGSAQVELLEPIGSEGAVARFLESKGPGMHHLAFHTDDIAGKMESLRGQGRPPIEAGPRGGARGHSVCFVHPKHCGGVLVELVSEGKEEA